MSSAPAPPAEYATIPIQTIAAGRSRATNATVVGDVTQVSHELDGDYHIRVQVKGAFLVLEIVPEFPLAPPHVGQQITAWGVVRHDGLHNWWELAAGKRCRPTGHGLRIERLTANAWRGTTSDDGSEAPRSAVRSVCHEAPRGVASAP